MPKVIQCFNLQNNPAFLQDLFYDFQTVTSWLVYTLEEIVSANC